MEKAHSKLIKTYSSELAIVVGALPLISGKAVRGDGKMYSEIKSEARKEFADKLRNLTASYWLDNINKGHIDNLLKEMEQKDA